MQNELSDAQLLRYSRHILLNEIGVEGQEKLCRATVLVVGCGGLGAAVLPYLAASGVGRLILADDDTVDETNLQRQTAYAESDVGQYKALVMQRFLQQRNSACRIDALTERLDEAQLNALLPQCQAVVDCCDNFATRQAVNRAAVACKTPLISGAAVRFAGQLAVYRPDTDDSPCYACLFDMPHADDGACAVFGVFSPLVGVIGAAQAAETLKVLLGLPSPVGVLQCYNALSGEWQRFRFGKNPQCPVCG